MQCRTQSAFMFKNPVPVQAQNETTIDYINRLYTICIERERFLAIYRNSPTWISWNKRNSTTRSPLRVGECGVLTICPDRSIITISVTLHLHWFVIHRRPSSNFTCLGNPWPPTHNVESKEKPIKESKVKTVRDSYAQQTTISPSAAVRTEVDFSPTIVALCYFHLPKNDPHCIASCCQGSTGKRVAGIDLVGWSDTAQA